MRGGRWAICLLALIFLVAGARGAIAQDKPGPDKKKPAKKDIIPDKKVEVTEENIDKAVKKGAQWLRTQQKADGSWTYEDEPFELTIPGIPEKLKMGCTALCCLAMLKAGVSPDDPAIKKGMNYCRNHKLVTVYGVACFVLALEALYTVPLKSKEAEKEGSPEGRMRAAAVRDPAKKFRKRASSRDKHKMKELILWLLRNQEKNVWRYPGYGEDASNTQYVALAFRISLPVQALMKVAEWFAKNQEPKGPKVESFPVPAADHSMKELRRLEGEIQRGMRKIESELARDKDRDKADSMTTQVVDTIREKLYKGEKHEMYARGWCYMPEDPKGKETRKEITGSMTTSGIIALTVSKAYLEGSSMYKGNWPKAVDRAIRDGCGWLAHHWTVKKNPAGSGKPFLHHYYYLYGLERAGMITLTSKFGEHDWFKEGATLILGQQRDDGRWDCGKWGTSGPVPDTCFAILFLKKATQPIVNVPAGRPETADPFSSPKKKK